MAITPGEARATRPGRSIRLPPSAWMLAVLGVLLAGAAACGRSGNPPPPGHEAIVPEPPPAPPPPSSPSAIASASVPVAAPPLDPKARIAAFFAQYKDGSDFEFLRTSCASPVERFISMKNAEVGAVVASARQFFRDKRSVKYVPDLAALQLRAEGERTVASLPLTMSWGAPPPAAWTTAESPREDLLDSLGPLYAGRVLQETTLDVELTFAKDGLLTRYLEGTVHRTQLVATGLDECDAVDDVGPGQVALRKGTVVTDLGQTFMTSLSAKGPEIVRLVRVGGKDVWVNDSRYYPVPNPYGGTSAGGGPCLEPFAGQKVAR